MKGSAQEALYYFKKISRRDPDYRDVLERIEALQGASARAARGRPSSGEDEFDNAFEELFESKQLRWIRRLQRKSRRRVVAALQRHWLDRRRDDGKGE